jgi:hypothetical protein
MENRKDDLKSRVLGFSVAVMNALDLAFGDSKGKILENWLKAMDGPGEKQGGKAPTRSTLSPGAKAFFLGMPQRAKRG